MTLQNALLMVLYLNGGRVDNQFIWNLLIFFVYMGLSDSIPMHPIKFTPTKFGPWCCRLPNRIKALEERGLISSHEMFQRMDDFDEEIAREFVKEPRSYVLTDNGRKVLQAIIDEYAIRMNHPDIMHLKTELQMYTHDGLFLMESIKNMFPDMIIRRKKNGQTNTKLHARSNHKKPNRVSR